jgi:hypothetical protein
MSITDKVKPLAVANLFQCCKTDIDFLTTLHSAPGEALTKGPQVNKDTEHLERLRSWIEELNIDTEKCKELLIRFNQWDEAVHASSGELDHALRRKPELLNRVVNCLRKLIEAVETGEFTRRCIYISYKLILYSFRYG